MKKGQSKSIGRLKRPKPYYSKREKRWIARVYVGSGKYRSRSCQTKADAYEAIDDLWQDRQEGVDGSETVATAVAEWLRSGSWKAKTRQDYSDTAKKFDTIESIPLDRLKESHIRQMLSGIKSAAGRKRVRRVLNTCLNWCVTERKLRKNPITKATTVRYEQPPVQVFDKHEPALIFKQMPEQWALAAELMFRLALRPGELWGLQWSDWRGDRITISRNIKDIRGRIVVESVKTAAGHRTLPIDSRAIEILEIRRKHAFARGFASKTHPIFCGRSGVWGKYSYFRSTIWPRALTDAGVDYRVPYTLRHTAATLMLNSGQVSLTIVSRWLGHKNIETTLRHYAHLMTGELEQATKFWQGIG